MDDLDRAVFQRVPLAQASLLLLAHGTSEPFLNDLYERNRGRCYEKELSFPVIVRLISDALIQYQGSGRKSCDHAVERSAMPVTHSAFYRKLRRIPLRVSHAFLSETTKRIAPLSPAGNNTSIPQSLRSMVLLPIDGKKIKHVAKRTTFLRDLPGSVIGAKVLVALRLQDGLAVALEANPDGESNDCPLVAGLLAQVRQVVVGTRLFIADRQFCGAEQLDLFADGEDHYLVRRTTTARFTPDPKFAAKVGKDSHGRNYVDEIGTLFCGAKARRVRQITLTRPGEETIILITDLLDQEAFPASDLLEAYLQRWGIEQVFQQITEVFSLRSLIGSSPEAVVFQCALCLLLYNAMRIVRDIIADTHSRERDDVSLEQIFCDTRDQFTTLRVMGVLEKAHTLYSQPMTDEMIRLRLTEILGAKWKNRWLKSPKKKKVPAKTKAKQSGAHTSVLRAKQAYDLRKATYEKPIEAS